MYDDAFRALASPVRRELLRLVRDEGRAVGDLASATAASQPATSQHLSQLREAGLVTVEVDGRRRLYRADLRAIGEVRVFFDDYWISSVDRLAAAAERAASTASSDERVAS
jgi:DNA-binding transcriptional ArsR family regulator